MTIGENEFQIDFGDAELNDPNYEANIDKQGDADAAPTQPPTDGETPQGGDDTATQQQAPDGQSNGAQAGDGGAQKPDGQQQQGQDDKRAPAYKADDKGNLIDKDGKIVAQAGAERRAFERAQYQDRYIKRLEGDVERMQSDAAKMQALNGAPEKLGLQADEVQIGLQAIASFKKDPVATARWMLQETMRQGYNLQQIVGADAQGQVNGGSMDLQAVRNMINEAVQPLVGDRQTQQQQAQASEAAQREYERFMSKHDHASVQEPSITALMRRDSTLTPEVAYWQLREYAAKNGYDFSQPLGPQVQARQQGGQQQQTPAPNGNANPQAQQQPMPNGGAPTMDMQTGPTMADPDDGWDTIVNQSLREAGMLQ